MYDCYAGKILRVDLSTGKTETQELNETLARMFVGGKGFGAKLIFDEFVPGTDPFAPENPMVISTGPLTGTVALSPKCSFATKSPLTGGWLDCTLGGHVGPAIKFAGYDVVILSGKSQNPAYVFIDDGKVTIKDASHLWGKSSHETETTLKKELGDQEIRVASIGQAGENLVRYACVTADLYRQAGRGGVGAVWGSKNLKALAIRGTGQVGLSDGSRFNELVLELNGLITKQGKTHNKYGTMFLVDPINDSGMLPTRNFQEGVFENVKKINADAMLRVLKPKNVGCFGCNLKCAKLASVTGGEFGSFQIEGPEYETACHMGATCGVDDLKAIAYLNLLCDQLGMDTISTGGVLSFAMECYQRGILTAGDLEGLELEWGNYNAMVELVKKIALREGIGDLLAEGTRRAAEEIGKDASRYALHVRGLEIPSYDPRGALGMALAYVTADRGGCHVRAWTIYEEVMGGMDRFSTEGKAELVACRVNRKALMDSLGICEHLGMPAIFMSLLEAASGWKIDPIYSSAYGGLLENFCIDGDPIDAGERISNLTRAFNIREGFGRKDDVLPARFLEEELPSGKSKGRRVNSQDLTKMLDEYFQLCGWTEEGIPTRDTLVRLGLPEAAQVLWPA